MQKELLVPYTQINGAWTFSDDYAAELWRKMVEEKTAKKVFYTGRVHDTETFINFIKSPGNNVNVIMDEQFTPLLLSWLNMVEDRHGLFNFNCYRIAWGRENTVRLMLKCADYWFSMKDSNGDYLFEVLYGVTPENNRLALSCMKNCGTVSLPAIPNFVSNAYTKKRMGVVISYMENPKNG